MLLKQELKPELVALILTRSPVKRANHGRDQVHAITRHECPRDSPGSRADRRPEQERDDWSRVAPRLHKWIDCLDGGHVALSCDRSTNEQTCAFADRDHPPVWQVNRAMPNTGRRKDSGLLWIVIGGTRTVYAQTPAVRNTHSANLTAGVQRTLLNGQQRWRVLPYLFQTIERPLVDIEDVDDDVTVVDQNPTGRRRSLDSAGIAALFLQLFHHVSMDSSELALVLPRTDDEAVGHSRCVMDIDHHGILGGCVGDHLGDPDSQVAARGVERLARDFDLRLFRQEGVFGCDEVPP